MKYKIFLFCGVFISSSLLCHIVSLEQFIDKALDTWAEIDLVRAIAQRDQSYLYHDVIKANLELYATMHGLFENNRIYISKKDAYDIENLLLAIAAANRDVFSNPKTGEEACSCVVMEYMLEAWERFRKSRLIIPGDMNGSITAEHGG